MSIREVPEPQPATSTEYEIAHHTCPECQREVVATNPDCPKKGIFANNTIAQVNMLKYGECLLHQDPGVFKQQYGLNI